MFGQSLDSDGNLYAALATGTKTDVPFPLTSSRNIGFTLNMNSPLKVSIVFRNGGTLTHRETNGPGGKVYGYNASLYDYIIANFTGTNRLGADNPPYSNRWFNFEECSAVVPTNAIFDTGWHWHRDVRTTLFVFDPTTNGVTVHETKNFTSPGGGTGEGNDSSTTQSPEDATPDGNRLIINPDAPGPYTTGYTTAGMVLAKRFYAREWLTYQGIVVSDIVKWRSFTTVKLGANGVWSRFGTGMNFVDLTPANDPESPAATLTALVQQIFQ